MVVGSAQQLAKCGKGPSNGPEEASAKGTPFNLPTGAAEEKPGRKGAGEGEGAFLGMERVSAPKGSVMVWSSAQALKGMILPQIFSILLLRISKHVLHLWALWRASVCIGVSESR